MIASWSSSIRWADQPATAGASTGKASHASGFSTSAARRCVGHGWWLETMGIATYQLIAPPAKTRTAMLIPTM